MGSGHDYRVVAERINDDHLTVNMHTNIHDLFFPVKEFILDILWNHRFRRQVPRCASTDKGHRRGSFSTFFCDCFCWVIWAGKAVYLLVDHPLNIQGRVIICALLIMSVNDILQQSPLHFRLNAVGINTGVEEKEQDAVFRIPDQGSRIFQVLGCCCRHEPLGYLGSIDSKGLWCGIECCEGSRITASCSLDLLPFAKVIGRKVCIIDDKSVVGLGT